MAGFGIFDSLVPGGSGSAAPPPVSESLADSAPDFGIFNDLVPKPRGNVAEAGRAFARGVVGGAGQAASGVSALMPEGAPDLGVGSAGKAVTGYARERFAPSKGREESLVNELPEAIGGMVPGAAAVIGGSVVGSPAAGLAAGAGIFGAQGAGGAAEEAEAKGATPGQRQAAAAGGAVANAALSLVPGGQLTRLLGLPGAVQRGILGYAMRTASAAGEGASIGAIGRGIDNAVAQYTYDPDRTLTEGAGHAALLTGASAGILHGLVGELGHRNPETAPASEGIPPAQEPQRLLPPPAIPMGEGAAREPLPSERLALPAPRTPDATDRAFIEGQHATAGGTLGPNTGREPNQFIMPDQRTEPGRAAEPAARGQAHPLDLVAKYESGNRPLIGWGNTDLSRYPLSDTGFPMWPGKAGPQGNSTAAGLYQITRSTWDPIAKRLGITDFSAESQRAVAEELYRTRGLQPWAPNNPRLAEAIARGEVAEPAPLGLPAPEPRLALPKPDTVYGDDFTMSESKPAEAQKLLPKPTTTYGEGFVANAPQTGTALERAMYAVSQLNPGDPVTRRLLGQLSGLRSADQVATLRDRLVNRGLVTSTGGRYLRAETVNEPERIAPQRASEPQIPQIPQIPQEPQIPAPIPGPTAEARAPTPIPEPPQPSVPPTDFIRPARPDQMAITATGRAMPVDYGIAHADQLIASHGTDLTPNPEFPSALQPRDRSRVATELQINDLLNPNRFRPELLGETPDASTGAPIVGPDRVVESGNARTIALQRAYNDGLPAAETYRNYLQQQGYPIEGNDKPVLVRLNRTDWANPADREAAAREMNAPMLAAMSSTERALADAKALPTSVLDLHREGEITSAQNRQFVRRTLESVSTPQELGALVDQHGEISAEGLRRVRGALIGKAYGDPDLVSRLIEDSDSNVKAIGNALTDAAPAWAKMRSEIQAGRVPAELDITPHLVEAVSVIAHARSQGRDIMEFTKQRGLFSDRSPETEEILKWMLGPEYTRRVGQAKITEAARWYAEEALKAQPGPDLLGERPQTRVGPMIERARVRAQDNQSGSLFGAAVGEPQGAEPVRAGAAARGETNQGPGIGEAGAGEPPGGLIRQQRLGAETVPGVIGSGAGTDRSALRDELYRLVKERAPTLRLRTFDDLFGMVEGRTSPIHGAYHTDERPGGLAEHIAVIALGGPDARAALSHEITHFLRHAGLFTKQEWSVLSGKADKWADQFKVNERYSDQPLGIRREEAIAEAYAAWEHGSLPLPPGLRRIFGKAKDFFEKVGNFLRGNGYQSSEDVFQRMSAGEIGGRTEGATAPETMHARPAMADDRVEAALKAIRATPDDRPLSERSLGWMKQAVNRIRDEARYAAIDSFDPIAKLEKGTSGKLRDASVSAFKAAHLSRELPAMMGQIVGVPDGKGGFIGGVPMLKDGAYVTRPDSKPLSAVLKPVFDAGLQKPFELWMAVTRGKRLMAEGREHLISKEMIAEFKDLDRRHLGPNGENLFRETQKEWIRFNDHLLDFAEQAGLINTDQRALWNRGDYVPFFRNMGEESPTAPGRGARGIANQSSGIKALTGGTEKLNSLYENMFNLSESLVGRAVKNEAALRTRDLAEPLGAMQKVPLSEKMASQGKRGDNIVSLMDKGTQQYYRVAQPLLYKAITAFGPVEANKITQLLGMPKALLTKMVTHEPTFMAANLMRDTLHAWVVTGADFKPGLDSAKGAMSALRNSPSAMSIMAGGGGGPHFYAKDAAGFVRDMEGKWTALNTPRKLWDQLERVGSASEMANRIAVYEAALKRGDSHAEAIWQSKDLLNFTASGGSDLMKFLIQTVPFMNARIQGLDRLQRGFRENPTSFLLRGSLITAASLGLWTLNKDNPEYQQLPDFEKQSYWHLFLPGFALRIPKPFEAGAIFGSVPEMLGDYADNGNWNQLWRAFVSNLSQQLNLSPMPQALSPAFDVARNVNSLTDAPIVSEGEKHLVPGERAGPNSSATMKALGQQIGVSPDQMEYLFKGYTGTLGSYLLSSADALTNATTGAVRPATRVEQYPIVGRFVRAEPILANRWINGFYDIKTEVDQLHATMNSMRKEGRSAEVQQLVKDNLDKLSLYSTTQSVGHQLTAVRQAMKQINDAPNMSSTEKRERLDELVAVRNRIGEGARHIVTQARP